MTRWLQQIRVHRYGGLAERIVGPFGPGLNVVFGPNEAGKSTLASLVGGVLFGWEEAHGVRNTYRPPEGERAGELVFCDMDGASGVQVALARDERGASGDMSLLADIDRETFEAVFSFSANELRGLRDSSDVTAQLLTAASGMGASPTAAFVQIEERIARGTRQVLDLSQQLERCREQVKQTTDQVQLSKQEDRELYELVGSREAVAERIEAANTEIEDLVVWRGELEAADARTDELRSEIEQANADRRELMLPMGGEPLIDRRLLALDSTSERVLRARIDELAEQQEKADRVLDAAKENSATSTAAYEALVELERGAGVTSDSSYRRAVLHPPRVAVSVLLPLVFIAAGVPLFMHGREITSLSITVLGLGLVVSAIFLAAAAIVMLFRPSRGEAELEKRLQDAQWVMLQDRKKLDASISEKERISAEIATLLEQSGLLSASGSVRQARTLLDEAASARAEIAADNQRIQAIDLRIHELKQQLSAMGGTRQRIESDLGILRVTLREFDALVRKRVAERDALVESARDMSQRIGELTSRLDQAKRDESFPLVKANYHAVRARLREAKHDLIELLLAKRMLDRSIASWENRSQPEVYAQAGRLLAMITGGKWVEVATSATGSLVAVGADGVARDPRHLSFGTCQQLYLALRIALLLVAREVGQAIPVLADDVLVNFDSERRMGAARALAQLARERQVVVFTCHRETLGALQASVEEGGERLQVVNL